MKESELIEFRLRSRTDARWDNWRVFVQGVRAIAFGDWSALGVMPKQDTGAYGMDDAVGANDDTRFRPVQMRDSVEGRDNHLFRSICNMVMGLTNNAPSFQVEGIDKDHALMHRLFLEKTLGPRPWGCNLHEVQRSVLVDAFVAGVGFFMEVLRDGVPEITRCDPLKIVWDQVNGSPSESKWVIIEDTQRASFWRNTFPKAAEKGAFDAYKEADVPVTVAFYYDVTDSTKGKYCAYLCGSQNGMTLVDEGEYPFFYEYDVSGNTYRFCYLPITPLYFQWLPGLAYPDSIAFRMIPHQRTILECNASALKRLRVGPKRVTKLSALSENTRDELNAGRDPDNYYIEEGETTNVTEATTIIAGVPIDQTISAMKSESERMITAMSGEDPFTSGANNDRSYEKATQVVAVQQSSQVSAAYRSEILSNALIGAVQKHLWACCEYYDSPIELLVDEDVLEFDAEDRVGAYLDPNARVIVQKDQLRYMPQDARISRAQNIIAQLANLAQLGLPVQGGLQKATEDFLKANGVEDIEGWLLSADTEMENAMLPGQAPEQGMGQEMAGPTPMAPNGVPQGVMGGG